MNDTLLGYLPSICENLGVENAVICAGSRSAPLTLTFTGFSKIKCIAANDERSAGYLALGLSKGSKKPVVVIATSGTAVSKLYSAIIEAFFQNIPLYIFTADRPPDAYLKFDGQAIIQKNIFKTHTIFSENMPVNLSDESEIKTIYNKFYQFAQLENGPIHINFPFEEPFYPKKYPVKYSDLELINTKIEDPKYQDFSILDLWNTNSKIILLCGSDTDLEFDSEDIYAFSNHYQIPIIADISSGIQGTVLHSDLVIRNIIDDVTYQPNIILTIGKNHTSKVLKNYISGIENKNHIHISTKNRDYDFFGTPNLTITSKDFFKSRILPQSQSKNFYSKWDSITEKSKIVFKHYILSINFHELKIVHAILHSQQENIVFHFSNSMAVRWGNIIGNTSKNKVYVNRGTSGIDGCTSTAIGIALSQPNKKHILITGDMAFQYDNNAFFYKELPSNLTIYILNNHGGRIFTLIDGPSKEMPINDFFVNTHQLNFGNLAKHYQIPYQFIQTYTELEQQLSIFQNTLNICEISVPTDHYESIFNDYKFLKL